jgi:hypothetical protein
MERPEFPLLLPLADEEGIAATKDLYLKRLGRTLTDAEAADVLQRLMTIMYLISKQ